MGCEITDPFVVNALGIGEDDAACRHAAKARPVVRRRRCGCILDRGHAETLVKQPQGRMGNADIGFQSHQHAFAAARVANGFENIGLAAEAEDFLVVYACAGAQLLFKLGHQWPVTGDILSRGDNRDFKDAGHLHKPGYALDQRLSPIERKLCQKIVLNIDDNERASVG